MKPNIFYFLDYRIPENAEEIFKKPRKSKKKNK